jgi:hypothetical protein
VRFLLENNRIDAALNGTDVQNSPVGSESFDFAIELVCPRTRSVIETKRVHSSVLGADDHDVIQNQRLK